MHTFLPWIEAVIRSRLGNRHGQADLIVIALVLFFLWLLVTGRRVVVQ